MPKSLATATGVTIQIGRELGRGGEGSVYDIPALADQVAKLYHAPLDREKQAKLSFMAAQGDAQLLNYVAWPLQTLHAARDGPVVGFLMPKLVGREPIHMVYSPAHRRQTRPTAAWDFLLFTARNLAASFETLHARGHVVADVNQGNVLVGKDSKVMLIDSDSFQVNGNGRLHRCDVGVSHFTPPELQGISSFDGITRTVNHDNFGLALLIFHLLFGGRHPYAGVPLRDGVGESLEADIKAFRYAYARDSPLRGLKPPPRSIPISIVPDPFEAMFAFAFTERGASSARPTAKHWVEAVDGLRRGLRPCSVSARHKYSAHLSKCPWCSLEHEGVVYFIDLGAAYTPTSTGFVLAQAWALIEAVPAPPSLRIPDFADFDVKPTPLPPGIPPRRVILGCQIVASLVALVLIASVSKYWVIWLIGGGVAYAAAATAGKSERDAERARRRGVLATAKAAHEALVTKAENEAGPRPFSALKANLVRLRDEYPRLPELERQELHHLHATAQERQKQQFLDGHFIDSASIPGVGPNRKAALRSFGIETAADVDAQRIRQIKGFGDSLTGAIVDWRRSCESRFRFDPARAVSQADQNVVRVKYGSRKLAIENALRNGPQALRKSRQDAIQMAATLEPLLNTTAVQVAQASRDLKVI
jgi:DNA-binding helix-hairpin-helix protein with protein kinase domain